jgi:hypothetical protein
LPKHDIGAIRLHGGLLGGRGANEDDIASFLLSDAPGLTKSKCRIRADRELALLSAEAIAERP